MGIYLSQPSRSVQVESGHSETVKFAMGEMQGWRKNMEDSHVACVDLSSECETTLDPLQFKDIAVFGVFDGHGGKEVAKFVQTHYLSVLMRQQDLLLSPETVGQALKTSFHAIDDMLEDPAFDTALQIYKKIPNPSDIETAKNTPVKAKKTSGDDSDDSDENELDDNAISSVVRSLDDMALGNNGNSNNAPKSKDDSAIVADLKKVDDERTIDLNAMPLKTLEVLKRLIQNSELIQNSADDTEEAEGRSEANSNLPAAVATAPTNVMPPKPPSAALSVAKPSGDEEAAVDAIPVVTYTRSPRGTLQCMLANHRVHAGCTANVVVKWKNKLIVANAGDSRSVLCRGDNRALALSEDHKPNQPGELERIRKSGGFVSSEGRINGNLNLSRSLGDLKYKQNQFISKEAQMISAEPDIMMVDLEPTDKFVIIGCDGIWDCLTNQEACDLVREKLEKGISIDQIVQEVCQSCLAESPRSAEGIGCDNMTIMIIELNPGKIEV